eukprot:CAMPEP_0196573986 /NCGR_PEP_ID=MMETSP1081-20130531/3794_1 /TAXON_ID=36882 /ORGANISM="Pyramimonas amylifera, Strain CCMP720" /LENGTH=260 /DNA_ID=CAMNT_0041891869 /DNA_START=152 /DNA_END=934 /DNA_ORIENTATION=-
MYLISALKDTPTCLKEISERLGVPKSAPVRFATAEKMQETLQVQPGSVTPFAVMCESAASVRLLLDAKFKECKTLLFHPFINTATTVISPEDFDKFLVAVGRTPEYVDFSETTSLQIASESTKKSSPMPKKEKMEKSPKPKKEAATDPKSPPAGKPNTADCTIASPGQTVTMVSSGPVEQNCAPIPTNHELSSDEWASGKFGRPSGKLDVKSWCQTIYAMPLGWENAPKWLKSLELDERPCGALTAVPWTNSIFQKPVGF